MLEYQGSFRHVPLESEYCRDFITRLTEETSSELEERIVREKKNEESTAIGIDI